MESVVLLVIVAIGFLAIGIGLGLIFMGIIEQIQDKYFNKKD